MTIAKLEVEGSVLWSGCAAEEQGVGVKIEMDGSTLKLWFGEDQWSSYTFSPTELGRRDARQLARAIDCWLLNTAD